MTRVCPKCERKTEKEMIAAVMMKHAYDKDIEVPKTPEMKPFAGSDAYPIVLHLGLRMYPHVCPVCGYVEFWSELE